MNNRGDIFAAPLALLRISPLSQIGILPRTSLDVHFSTSQSLTHRRLLLLDTSTSCSSTLEHFDSCCLVRSSSSSDHSSRPRRPQVSAAPPLHREAIGKEHHGACKSKASSQAATCAGSKETTLSSGSGSKGASSWLTLVRGLVGSLEVRKIGDLGKRRDSTCDDRNVAVSDSPGNNMQCCLK